MVEEKKTKECGMCLEDKPYTDFRKDATRKDGYQSYCIPCFSSYMKEWKRRKKLGLHGAGISTRKYNVGRMANEAFKNERENWKKEYAEKLEYILTHKEEFPAIFFNAEEDKKKFEDKKEWKQFMEDIRAQRRLYRQKITKTE